MSNKKELVPLEQRTGKISSTHSVIFKAVGVFFIWFGRALMRVEKYEDLLPLKLATDEKLDQLEKLEDNLSVPEDEKLLKFNE